MNKLSALFVVGLLGGLLSVTAGAEPVFQEKSSDMTSVLSQPPSPSGAVSKGFSLESMQEIEVIRQKGLDVDETREFVPVQRRPAARLNLKIEFDFDSANVRRSSDLVLAELGKSLNDPNLAGVRVVINGHTDSVGSDQYNLLLSFRRAKAVRDYLIDRHGIDPRRLEIAGYGESLPLVSNDSDFNRQLNRRVEIERL